MRKRDMHKANEKGFTLLEALVAMVILGIGVFSLYSMQVASIDGNAKAARISYGTNWATDQIENIISLPYDDLLMEDDDLDGTDQDTSAPFGVDDDGGDFGLSDTGNDADGSLTSPDGFYTVFWNVAIDQRMVGLKSIRIIVRHNGAGDTRDVVMDFIKPEV